MLIYSCKVIDPSGEIKTINLSSLDINSLKTEIKNRELTLLSYKKTTSYSGIKLKKVEILNFTGTLTLLLNSNLSLKDSIEISLSTLQDKNLKLLSNLILTGLKRGDTLSSILTDNTTGFSPLYLGLIQVGEKTGTLKSVLQQLNNYLERDKKFKDKLSGALIYPIFIMSMTTIFSILFIIVILPKFNLMFKSLGGGMGDILIQRGTILTYLIIGFLLFVLTIMGFLFYIKNLSKKEYIKAAKYEKYFLKIPFIGKLIIENETFNLIFALSVLTKSSLSIESSIDYGKGVLVNSFLKLEVENIKKSIISGESLSASFGTSIFPGKISSFVKVGERTGDISTIFTQLSSYYLKESDKKIERLMVIIDPLFTLLVGSVLLSLIILFILPVLTKMGDLL